jgi:hypothetical protein
MELPVRPLGPPPAEVIVVPEQSLVRDVRHAATQVLGQVYRMFNHKGVLGAPFEVVRVVGGLPDQVSQET